MRFVPIRTEHGVMQFVNNAHWELFGVNKMVLEGCKLTDADKLVLAKIAVYAHALATGRGIEVWDVIPEAESMLEADE